MQKVARVPDYKLTRDDCITLKQINAIVQRYIGSDWRRAPVSLDSYRLLCEEMVNDPKSNCVHFDLESDIAGCFLISQSINISFHERAVAEMF